MTGSAMAEGVGVVETVSAALYTVRWKAQSLWDMKTRHGAIGPTLNESVWFMVASCVVITGADAYSFVYYCSRS